MSRPVVIAHRGASGYLPEHTAEAKVMAHAFGADFLEQDVVATREGALVVLHDVYLDEVTDVAERFAGRARDDGRHYAIDFELAELETLNVLERRDPASDRALFPARFPRGVGRFRVMPLDAELELIEGLNHSTTCSAGIYPEIKHPRWHLEHGIDLTRALLALLAVHGFTDHTSNVFVQCFDAAELRRARDELGTQLKLVQLLGGDADLSAVALEEIAGYADGIGLPYAALVELHRGEPRPNGVCRAAQAAGLLVHPYTFRRDQLPAWADSLEALLELFFATIGVDGVFCDHPDVAVGVRARLGLD